MPSTDWDWDWGGVRGWERGSGWDFVGWSAQSRLRLSFGSCAWPVRWARRGRAERPAPLANAHGTARAGLHELGEPALSGRRDADTPFVRSVEHAVEVASAPDPPQIASSASGGAPMSIYGWFQRPGPNGFGFNSTAEQVLDGLDLGGRTVRLTGRGSGRGAETMRVATARGATVIGAARTLDAARAACAPYGDRAIPIACELSEP